MPAQRQAPCLRTPEEFMSLPSSPKSAPTGSSMEFAPKQRQDSIRLRDALLSRGVSNSGRRLLFGLEVAMKRANAGSVLAWCLVFPLIFVNSAFSQSCNPFIGKWKCPSDELTIAKDGDGFLVVIQGLFIYKYPAECKDGKLVLSQKMFGDMVYSKERDVLYLAGAEYHRVVGGPPAGGAGIERTPKLARKAAI